MKTIIWASSYEKTWNPKMCTLANSADPALFAKVPILGFLVFKDLLSGNLFKIRKLLKIET